MARSGNDVTNGMILRHMQGMKYELEQKIGSLGQKMNVVKNALQLQIVRLEQKVDQGFDDARRHRQALQEDLEETMRVQSRHDTKLARL